jgi:hypothetical protein
MAVYESRRRRSGSSDDEVVVRPGRRFGRLGRRRQVTPGRVTRVLRFLGLAIAGLAIVAPAGVAFAADPTPSAVPTRMPLPAGVGFPGHGSGALPGIGVSHGILRLLGSPAAEVSTGTGTDRLSVDGGAGGPAVVLGGPARAATPDGSASPSAPGLSAPVDGGPSPAVGSTGSAPTGVDQSSTGSRAPPTS